MHIYSAYGLILSSELYLPELVPTVAQHCDVIIRRAKLGRDSCCGGLKDRFFELTTEGAYLSWEVAGAFFVQNGSQILFDPNPHCSDELVRLPLLGPVLTVLLHQRGILALHGSVVASSEGAVAFLGKSGEGKSTMAAALQAEGYKFVADDTVALNVDPQRHATVIPSFPRQKLWPDTIAALGEEPERLPRLHPDAEKRDYRILDNHEFQPVPLHRIYILETAAKTEIVPLKPEQAIIQLLGNLTLAELGSQLIRTKDTTFFRQCAELAKQVPTYRLRRPKSLSSLSNVAQIVKAHSNIDEIQHPLLPPNRT